MLDKFIVKRDDITLENPQVQMNWLIEVGQNLESLEKMEDSVIIVQAKILYEVWSIWEAKNNPEHKALNQEATSPWQYDFYVWAKAYTKRRAKLPAKDTIDNKIRVYKNWSQLIEPPETVVIVKRDEFGRQTGETEEVDFNFEDCDYGKLLQSTVHAREGSMTPEAWAALRDPLCTNETLKEKLGVLQPKETDNFYLDERDGIIYGCQGSVRIPVLQVLWENEDNDLFSKTLCHVLKCAGLRVPLSYQK